MHEQNELTTSAPDRRPARAERLETGGGLRHLHWFVVALSLLLTLIAWSTSTRALEQRNAQRFGRQADKVIAQFVEQVRRHADVLTAAAGLVMASEEVNRDEWQIFSTTLDLEEKFPALTGIAIAQHVLADDLPAFLARERAKRPDFGLSLASGLSAHLPMVLVAPSRLEPAIEGLDLARDDVRREAADRAAESGTSQLTAPVSVSTATGEAPGLIMMVPFYHGGPVVSPEQRAERFAGVVVGAMLLDNIDAGALDTSARQIRVRISDNGAPLYNEIERANEDVDPTPLYTLARKVSLHGREWRIDIQSTIAFRHDSNRLQPLYVLVGGLSIDALLLALMLLHARADRRLHRTASDLQDERTALAASNEKLEAFACVASHDLKAPLIGIRTLVDFIEDDLDDYLRSDNAVPDIPRNLSRVRQQAARANALIDGILVYSGLGNQSEPTERVDTRAMLTEIGEMLDVGTGNLVLVGVFPVFETCATRLRQVLANLIGNAFKYHHDIDRAHVSVAVEEAGDSYRFSVSDDGPGIDARLHERIFEPFGKGHTDARDDSTGVGLAIVSKAVATMGGTISIDSAPGRGTTFTFDWPKPVDEVDGGAPEETQAALLRAA